MYLSVGLRYILVSRCPSVMEMVVSRKFTEVSEYSIVSCIEGLMLQKSCWN